MDREEYSTEFVKDKIVDEKASLLREFLELIKKTDSDPVRLATFESPKWKQNVTIDNLKFLIKSNDELLHVQEKAYKILTPMTEEERIVWRANKIKKEDEDKNA